MKTAAVLFNNGYTPEDQSRIHGVYDQLSKQGDIDTDLLDAVATKVAAWRLEAVAVIGGMLSLSDQPASAASDTDWQLALDIKRYWEWCQRLPAKPAHATSTANLTNLLLGEAAGSPALLVMLIVALVRVRTAEGQAAQALAARGLQIWAPLAHRLGLGQLQHSIEDSCFKIAQPEDYALVEEKLDQAGDSTAGDIKRLKSELLGWLHRGGVKFESLDGRRKHTYSIYRKLAKSGELDSVYDLYGLRLIVPTTDACYQALKVIHELWQPVSSRLKDYIAKPKANGYRSIHTIVRATEGHHIEIQIRTPAMHAAAEEGISAHWRYDQLKDSRDYQKGELVASAKPSRANQIYTFSPSGDVFRLPAGATALDFAYGVHSNLGNQARAVKINNKIAKLNSPLSSGDVVEVITQKNAKPHPDWLRYVVTNKARNRIRSRLQSP